MFIKWFEPFKLYNFQKKLQENTTENLLLIAGPGSAQPGKPKSLIKISLRQDDHLPGDVIQAL